MLVSSLRIENREGLDLGVFDRFASHTSFVQIAWHTEMAVLAVVFPQLSNVDF